MKRFALAVFWILIAGASTLVFGTLLVTIWPSPLGNEDVDLQDATPSDLSPGGDIAQTFSFFSDRTEIQKDQLESELKGKVVQWALPIRDITRVGGVTHIYTLGDERIVGIECVVSEATEEDRVRLSKLTVGALATCKGVIQGRSFGQGLTLRPSILVWN